MSRLDVTEVNRRNIDKVTFKELINVYFALSKRINIPFEDFINTKKKEYIDIRIRAVNLYRMSYRIGVNLLNNADDKRKEVFRANLTFCYDISNFSTQSAKFRC